MRLARKKRLGPMMSVTPLVDVMFILLIFCRVTSTFLDLDLIPLVGGARPADQPAPMAPAPAAERERVAEQSGSLLVRLGADGRTYVAGQEVDPVALTAMVSLRVAARPSAPILVLPSGAASTQALVSLMDVLTRAGAQDARVVRFEAQ